MDSRKKKNKLHEIYPNARKHNLSYWERMQKVLDATGTKSQNLYIRKKWSDRQYLTNYRNEFDRLMGEMSHLRPELRKAAVLQLMDIDKLKALGEYEEPKKDGPAGQAAPSTPAVPATPSTQARHQTGLPTPRETPPATSGRVRGAYERVMSRFGNFYTRRVN
jgi:hypothetical protein